MRLDVTQQVIDFDGNPVMTSETVCTECGSILGEEKALTFRDVIIRGLMSTDPAAQKVPSFEDNMNRWKLAQRIQKNDITNMSAAEAKLIQDQLCFARYSALVIGQVGTQLDGDKENDTKKS